MNIPSEFRIASIAPNHALILPNDANPGRIKFSERTGCSVAVYSAWNTFPIASIRPAPVIALRDFDLGGAKPILPRERSVSCSLLNQQAFRLEKEFEVDHGFHRTPLVAGCLEALQYVSPGVARSAQCHLLNKPYSLCCAAQYYWRARADTQLRINWKVRHGHLTPCRCPSSIRARILFLPRRDHAALPPPVRCPRPVRAAAPKIADWRKGMAGRKTVR
jgi:hypothetical protein